MSSGFYLKSLLASCFLFMNLEFRAQNLVPNPGFEDYMNCPTLLGGLNVLWDWYIPPGHSGSTDYYNTCSPSSFVGVPYNTIGFQMPRNGNGYAGLALILPNPLTTTVYREYMQVRLTAPLQANTTYTVGAYVNCGNINKFVTDVIGFHLSDTSVIGRPGIGYEELRVVAQVEASGNYFDDTLGWELAMGSFVAQGGEEYLCIGNFLHDSLTPYLATGVLGGGPNGNGGYVYIDDVFLVAGQVVGVPPIDEELGVKVIPTLLNAGEAITVEIENPQAATARCRIADLQGRVCIETDWQPNRSRGRLRIATSGLSPGCYLLETVIGESRDIVKVIVR